MKYSTISGQVLKGAILDVVWEETWVSHYVMSSRQTIATDKIAIR